MQKRLTEIIRGERPSLSFEVFPPKKSADFETVRQATEQIAALHPSYMSVTYGAGGGHKQLYARRGAEFGKPLRRTSARTPQLRILNAGRAFVHAWMRFAQAGLEIYSPCAAICLRIQTPPNWNFITPPNW